MYYSAFSSTLAGLHHYLVHYAYMNYRAFEQNNRILMLALDHRGSLEKMIPSSIPPEKKEETIVSVKKMLLEALAPYYSGVLFDSHYGLSAFASLKTDSVARQKPYLLCIEKTGYTDTNHERLTQLEYSVSELKEKGAKGIKLLLFFHPDAHTAQDQIALTQNVFDQCKKADVPFFLEILNYSMDATAYNPSLLVPKSVKLFLDRGINADVFKLEFPGNAAACQEVTAMLGNTPWILLTKGDTYEGFVASLKVASANGAHGFLAGRSIWQDIQSMDVSAWQEFIATTVVKRFQEISSVSFG